MTKRNTGLSAERLHKYFPQTACQSHLVFYGGNLCPNRRGHGMKICRDCAEQAASKIGWRSNKGWTQEQQDQVDALTEQLAQARRDHTIVCDALDATRRELWELQRMTPAERKRAKQPTEGTIYALLNGYNVKIGWTSNLERRLREYPPSSQLLVAYPGTRKDETTLKRKFSYLATHGNEWFPYAPQVIEWVDQMVTKHGEPRGEAGPRKTEPPRPHADKAIARPRDYRGKIA